MNKISINQIAIVILITLFWASCFPLIELGHRAAPPLRFAAIRSLIAGLSITLPMLLFKRRWLLNLNLWRHSFFIAITYTVLGFGGMFLADGRVTPGISTVLANTQPLIAAVLAFFFLNERLSKKNIFGFIFSFSGILTIGVMRFSLDSGQPNLIGILFILMGAFGVGAGNVLMKKCANTFNIMELIGLQFIIGFLILFPISHIFENHLQINWHPSFFWSLILLSIPGTSLATLMWLSLLKKVQLSVLNVFTFLTPGFGLLIGYFFFEERYSLVDFVGILMILIGIYMATNSSKFKVKKNI